jgi:DNA-binding protein YbaB
MSDKKNSLENLDEVVENWDEEFAKINKKLSSFVLEKSEGGVTVTIGGQCEIRSLTVKGISPEDARAIMNLINEGISEIKEFQQGIILKSKLNMP